MKEITNNEIKNYNLNLYNLANEKIEKLKKDNKYSYNQMLLEEIECDYSTLKLILRQLKDKMDVIYLFDDSYYKVLIIVKMNLLSINASLSNII